MWTIPKRKQCGSQRINLRRGEEMYCGIFSAAPNERGCLILALAIGILSPCWSAGSSLSRFLKLETAPYSPVHERHRQKKRQERRDGILQAVYKKSARCDTKQGRDAYPIGIR